jgi:hypothetical protein
MEIPKVEDLLQPNNIPSKKGIFSFFIKFKENKLYLLIFIGIIFGIAVLYYLYHKNKDKKLLKSTPKKIDHSKMMNVVESNTLSDTKLLYNPVDKQYYGLDSNGSPIKKIIDKDSINEQQKLEQQKLEQQRFAEQQQIIAEQQQRFAEQQQRIAEQQRHEKLTHQVESSDDTSENIEYDINALDDDMNISQFNLDSNDINDINIKLNN